MSYRKAKGINASSLKALAKSPAYYKYYIENGIKTTTAMEFGTLAHKYILEPEKFWDDYVVFNFPGKTKSSKEYKALQLDNPTKKVIKQEEFEKIEAMYLALNDDALALLESDGPVEKECYWDRYKALMDKVIPDKKIVVDYKSCASADPRFFISDAIKLGYHIQASHYLDYFPEEYEFVFIAQEKTPPYINVVYRCSPEFIAYGWAERERLLKLLDLCTETDKWFSYASEDTLMLELPSWAVTNSYDALDDEVGYQ